jgi:hypothetical protein
VPDLRSRSARPRRFAIVVGCLLIIGVLAVIARLSSTPGGLTATWTGWLNSGLETYADTAGQWNSGDGAIQVALPDGRALWLFNDSFYGPVNRDGTANPHDAHYVRNMSLLTSGTGNSFRVMATITGDITNGVPAPVVPPIPGSPGGSWAWPGDGLVQGSSVVAIYDVYAYTPGASGLNYAPVSSEIVTMPLSSLTSPSTYTAVAGPPSGCDATDEHGCVQWGVSMLNSTKCPSATRLSSCTYVYGEVWPSAGSGRRTLVEAVTPQGGLGTPGDWWYDTTSGWRHVPSGLASSSLASSSLASPLGRATVVNAVSVHEISAGHYVALDTTGRGVVAYYASTPDLADARVATLFTQPQPRLDGVAGLVAYQLHLDPAYSSGQSVVMGYSVNSLLNDKACLNYAPYTNIASYQPEFYSFTLPPSASAVHTGTLPAPQLRSFSKSPVSGEDPYLGPCTGSTAVPPPTGFQARYVGNGAIRLSWRDPGGLYQYTIRRSDADAIAWTQLATTVWDSPCPDRADNCYTDSASTSVLAPGHTYAYQVEAWNWTGGNQGDWLATPALVTLPARLTVAASGLCAGVPGGSRSAGAQLDQHSCVARSRSQEWAYVPTGQDQGANYPEYQIRSNNTDYCMAPASPAPGAAVDQESCTSAANAQWEFRIVAGNGDFDLYNPGTGLCLSVAGNSQSSGASLIQAACGITANTAWHSSLDY